MSLERYLRGVYVVKCGFIFNIKNPGANLPPPSTIRVNDLLIFKITFKEGIFTLKKIMLTLFMFTRFN